MIRHMFPKLHKALKFAVKSHLNQDRDGEASLPYVTHPIDVLGLVRRVGGVVDEDVLCAAVLHDVLEETSVTSSELSERFGSRVAALVQMLTREEPDASGLSKEELFDLRHKAMMQEIGRMDNDAQTIKLADRISNLTEALEVRTGKKLVRYIWQSEQIRDAIPSQVCIPLWELLDTTIRRARTVNLESP